MFKFDSLFTLLFDLVRWLFGWFHSTPGVDIVFQFGVPTSK